MHPLSPPVEELLRVLRSSAYPSLADDVETHLRLGRTRLFDEATDSGPVAKAMRAKALRGGTDGLALKAQPTDDDESEAYSEAEQIDEALSLMSTFIGVRVAVLEDSRRALAEMDRDDLTLRIEAEGDLRDLLQQRRSALAEWTRQEGRIREWLMTTAGRSGQTDAG